MRWMSARVRRKARGDAGFTMLEMIVSMVLMSIFMGIFGSSIVSMFRSADTSQSLANAAQQVNLAFQRMDTTIRYASYVSAPGQSGIASPGSPAGDWYVEIGLQPLPTDANPQKRAPTECRQLRVNTTTNQFQMRSWPVSTAGVVGPVSDWQNLASSVAPGAPQPFVLTQATSTSTVRTAQLTVNLVAWGDDNGAGARDPNRRTTASSVTFAAMNTTASMLTSGTCVRSRP